MHVPTDELIVFGPIGLLAVVYLGRQAYLAFKYRHVP
ncbi:MAG: hypothetical protein JWM80_5525 [Cyanobacteria bacterium RYN_339]|nr:hypothetical protein [Cyanobacteria bacterium RYN_339]